MNTIWRSQTHLDDSSWEKNLCELCADVMLCAIWCYLYNLQNVKNTHGLVLILVKLQAEAKPFLSLYIFVGKISRFLRFCSLLTDFSFFNKSSKEKFGSFLLTNLESLFFFCYFINSIVHSPTMRHQNKEAVRKQRCYEVIHENRFFVFT